MGSCVCDLPTAVSLPRELAQNNVTHRENSKEPSTIVDYGGEDKANMIR